MKSQIPNTNEPWLEQVAEAFDRQPIPPRPDDEALLSRMLSHDSAESSESDSRFQIWRYWNMKTTRGFALAAAVIAVALLMTGIFLPPSMSPQQAYAQMVANIAAVRSSTMRLVAQLPGQGPFEVRMSLMSPQKMRQDLPTTNVSTIYDFNTGQLLTLNHLAKRASLIPIASVPAGRQPTNIVEAFQKVSPEHAKLVDETGEQLVYHVTDGGADMKVWVDKETLLPLKIEQQSVQPGLDEPTVLVIDQFNWDAGLDESLFSLTPPDGYTMQAADAGEPGPDDLVRLLKLWTRLSEGAFPDELHSMSLYQISGPFVAFGERISDLTPQQQGEAWMDLFASIGLQIDPNATEQQVQAQVMQDLQNMIAPAGAFMGVVAEQSGWTWTGKGAHLGDDRIVCYWRAEDGSGYLGINAKLEVVRLTADRLPQQDGE